VLNRSIKPITGKNWEEKRSNKVTAVDDMITKSNV